ncbi:hypothetical protein FOA52_005868 [Chlamydomonas sp. UWO 241]|nr:hypothetical protein FOA52_005868 [Chlamydomonas sp. UWO 241]
MLREHIDRLADALARQAEAGVLELLAPLLDAKTLALLEPSIVHVSTSVKNAFQEALQAAVLPDLQRIVAGSVAGPVDPLLASPGGGGGMNWQGGGDGVATPATPENGGMLHAVHAGMASYHAAAHAAAGSSSSPLAASRSAASGPLPICNTPAERSRVVLGRSSGSSISGPVSTPELGSHLPASIFEDDANAHAHTYGASADGRGSNTSPERSRGGGSGGGTPLSEMLSEQLLSLAHCQSGGSRTAEGGLSRRSLPVLSEHGGDSSSGSDGLKGRTSGGTMPFEQKLSSAISGPVSAGASMQGALGQASTEGGGASGLDKGSRRFSVDVLTSPQFGAFRGLTVSASQVQSLGGGPGGGGGGGPPGGGGRSHTPGPGPASQPLDGDAAGRLAAAVQLQMAQQQRHHAMLQQQQHSHMLQHSVSLPASTLQHMMIGGGMASGGGGGGGGGGGSRDGGPSMSPPPPHQVHHGFHNGMPSEQELLAMLAHAQHAGGGSQPLSGMPQQPADLSALLGSPGGFGALRGGHQLSHSPSAGLSAMSLAQAQHAAAFRSMPATPASAAMQRAAFDMFGPAAAAEAAARDAAAAAAAGLHSDDKRTPRGRSMMGAMYQHHDGGGGGGGGGGGEYGGSSLDASTMSGMLSGMLPPGQHALMQSHMEGGDELTAGGAMLHLGTPTRGPHALGGGPGGGMHPFASPMRGPGGGPPDLMRSSGGYGAVHATPPRVQSLGGCASLGASGMAGGGGALGEPPARFQVLPDMVSARILHLINVTSGVISVRDFDEKVVNKMCILVELYGPEEALSMLAHLEHRMRTKQGVMKNGPGYLDVAVSSHLDMLRAQGSCPKSMTTEEYAAHTLLPPVLHELREAVANNKWLVWGHLDQGIIQLIKKLPRDSAVEKLQEISYHSFKNVDNIKGCIMSILNSKIREDRRRQ